MELNHPHKSTHSNGHTVDHGQTCRYYGRRLVVRTRGIIRRVDMGFFILHIVRVNCFSTPKNADHGEGEER